jgi:hypothetical protein
MLLTSKQKTDIRYYLGYQPFEYVVDSILERDYATEVVDIVVRSLARLDALETAINDAALQGHLVKVDVIEYNNSAGLKEMKSQRVETAKDLANLLGIEYKKKDSYLNQISILSV